jgi:hypothetical protein
MRLGLSFYCQVGLVDPAPSHEPTF